MNSKLQITGITVSVDLKTSNFGSGNSNFVSLKSEVIKRGENQEPDGLTIDEALDASLDLHLKAYESLLGARVGDNFMTGPEFKEELASIQKRFKVARKYLFPSSETEGAE